MNFGRFKMKAMTVSTAEGHLVNEVSTSSECTVLITVHGRAVQMLVSPTSSRNTIIFIIMVIFTIIST